jgi:putative transposase
VTAIVEECAKAVGIRSACEALGVSRASHYRWIEHRVPRPPKRRTGGRALPPEERAHVLQVLHEPRFADLAVPQVHAQLLDEGEYHCSVRTMYRMLTQAGENRERRNLRTYDAVKPELLATRPNELWSWDITKLLGPQKWTYYYLYVMLDVFSRYVVGWMLAYRESKQLARRFIADTCKKQSIMPGQLTLHADRGSSMTSKPVAFLCADLGITKTHSRPHVSDDNPYSESQFKTLKYRPEFPRRFGCIEDGRGFCRDFFDWYNLEHRHSALAMLTPHDVHHGLAQQRIAARAETMQRAFLAHPERFPHGAPTPKLPNKEVWINKPKSDPVAPPPVTDHPKPVH